MCVWRGGGVQRTACFTGTVSLAWVEISVDENRVEVPKGMRVADL